eukprot:4540796-Pleurochrysis_carterae.AAC.1
MHAYLNRRDVTHELRFDRRSLHLPGEAEERTGRSVGKARGLSPERPAPHPAVRMDDVPLHVNANGRLSLAYVPLSRLRRTGFFLTISRVKHGRAHSRGLGRAYTSFRFIDNAPTSAIG